MTVEHLSHSQITSYSECGERFRLERVEFKPQTPAWWTIAGSTLHEVTERFDEHFDDTRPMSVKELLDLIPPIWKKHKTLTLGDYKGEVRGAAKGSEDEDWWLKHLPEQVLNYRSWRLTTDWELESIELKVEAELGESRTPFVGYIDRVFRKPDGTLVILDLKSGRTAPSDPAQLGTYRVLFIESQGLPDDTKIEGYFFHTRTVRPRSKNAEPRQGTLIGPFNLTGYTAEYLGKMGDAVAKAKEQQVYVPRPSYFCGTCSVNEHCFAYKAANPPAPEDTGPKRLEIK